MSVKLVLEKFWKKFRGKIRIIDWETYVVFIMALIYSIVFSYFTILKHRSFRSGALDLGVLVQSIASCAKGKLFINNVELYYSPSGSYFGVHFAPILFLMVPFFCFIPSVETVLVIQSIVLGLGAIPVFLIAKHELNNNFSALFISITYLLNPLLHSINWYDFHTQSFFPLFILSSTYFLKRRRVFRYILCLILSLSTIEQAAYFLLVYALYCFWEMKTDFKINISIGRFSFNLLIPFFTFFTSFFWIIFSSQFKNLINPNPPIFITASRGFNILDISHPSEILGKALFYPDLTLKALKFELHKKILYLLLTFAPGCFLSFLSPFTLIPAFLWLFLAILSNWRPYYSLGFQYTCFTLPFISVSTIEGIKVLMKEFDKIHFEMFSKRISLIIFLFEIVLSLFTSPLSPVHKVGDYEFFRDYGISEPSILNMVVREIIFEIPEESSVLTTQNIFPHLSSNLNAYTIPPIEYFPSEFIEQFISYLKNNVSFDYILITYFWNKNDSELIYNKFLKDSAEYGLLIKGPGLELYKKGFKGVYKSVSLKFNYRELSILDSVFVDDISSESGKSIMLRASSNSGRTAWFGPYITLLPGNYTVLYKIKVDKLCDGKVIELDVYSKNLGKIVSYKVDGKDIKEPFMWHTFSINFNISMRVSDLEFRGVDVRSDVSVYLDYIEVIPE